MKARPLPHFKRKLNDIAKQLYLEHGWRLPKGFIDHQARDPQSFTIAEWQQAKRANLNPKALKGMFQECWAASDSKAAFSDALRERGFYLAKGDRRGFVAVDYRGEVYSLSRYVGVKAKALKERLGDPEALQSVDEAKAWVAERMGQTLRRHIQQLKKSHERQFGMLEAKRSAMAEKHRAARFGLREMQAARWASEERERAARLPKGIGALWGWFTGKNREIRKANEAEIAIATKRDRSERHALIQVQLGERRALQAKIRSLREKQQSAISELHRDIAAYMAMGGKDRSLSSTFGKARDPLRERSHGSDYEPEP